MSCWIDERPDSPNWYIYDYDERSGKTERFSTRTADRAKAEIKLAEYLIARSKGEEKSNATLVWVITRYWSLKGQYLASRDTVKRIMALLVEHEPDTELDDWPEEDQEEFISKMTKADGTPLSDGTKRRYFGAFKTAAYYLKDVKKELTSVPDLVNLEVEDGDGAAVIPVEVARKLFAACKHPHEKLYFLLEMTTTPRPKQLIELTWTRVLYEDRVVDYRVPGVKYKLKRRAIAPPDPYGARVPEGAPFGRPCHQVA